jgi:hypothetical protein
MVNEGILKAIEDPGTPIASLEVTLLSDIEPNFADIVSEKLSALESGSFDQHYRRSIRRQFR